MAAPRKSQRAKQLSQTSGAVRLEVEGAGDIYRLFDKLSTGRKNRAITAALKSAGSELNKGARKAAPRSKKGSTMFGVRMPAGSLRKSLTYIVRPVPGKAVSKPGDPIKAFVAIVGVKSEGRGGRTSLNALKLSATEFGTEHRTNKSGANRGQVRGTGWFESALLRNKGAAVAIFQRRFRERMLAEVKKKYNI